MGSINVHGLRGSEMISHKKNPKNITELLCYEYDCHFLNQCSTHFWYFSEFTHSSDDHCRALTVNVKNRSC